MKAKHRHELKTNELAEWIANMPQWASANLKWIVIVLAVAVGAAGALYYFRYQRNVVSMREELRFTELTSRRPTQDKTTIMFALNQGRDAAYVLLQLALDLETFAKGTEDDDMAALALIKRGEALRAELHYRRESVGQQEIAEQIGRARKSYNDALARSPSDLLVRGMANFGIGLCEEELGNFDEAKRIYSSIAENPELDGTVIVPQARLRAETMPDYSKPVVFKAAPVVPPSRTTTPPIPLRLPDVNVGNFTIPEANPGTGPASANVVTEPPAGAELGVTDIAESNIATVNVPGS
jgi:tetratricopeptide (TPR) repeat protein